MTISQQLRLALNSAFVISNGTISEPDRDDRTIVVNKIGGIRFIPSIYANNAVQRLRYLGRLVNGDIVIPLSSPHTPPPMKKTSDSIINTLFKGENIFGRGHNFNCVDTGKGYKYYGGKGLILDDDYIPLLICGYEVELIGSLDGGYKYHYPVCLINPDVFEKEDMVSKAIVRKVLPYYSSNEFGLMRDSNGVEANVNKVKVIITPEIKDFIQNVTPPLDIDINDSIYDLLNANLNEIRQ